MTLTLEDWENGFRKDAHPEQEIAIWLHIVSVYEQFALSTERQPEERRDVFRTLVACSMAPQEHVFEVLRVQAITRAEAEQIVEAYFIIHD